MGLKMFKFISYHLSLLLFLLLFSDPFNLPALIYDLLMIPS